MSFLISKKNNNIKAKYKKENNFNLSITNAKITLLFRLNVV